MNTNEFYTTARTNTNGNEYSATLPNLTDYSDKGFVPYYLGWISRDNIPETYHLTKISFDGTKLISKPLEITENADLFYTARNVNPIQIGGLSFASRYNSATGTYTSYYGSYANYIESVNKLSLLTQNINPPAFTFSFVYRTVSGSTFGNTLIATYNYNFTSIIDFINWLNGTYKINFNSVFSGITLTDTELSANDFLSNRTFYYSDSSYDGHIFISACTVSPRIDTNNDSTTNAGNSAIFGTTSITYKDENDTFDIYLHSQYHPTGQLQIFYSGTPSVYSNPITFYGYYFGGFDIETDLAEMSDTTEIYQGENWLAYRPYNLSNYRYFYKKMSISEIRFLFAMQPILRYTSDLTNIYYPKFEDGELTGEFFPSSRLAFDGEPWQITGNVTDNDYNPDTKPPIVISEDEITTEKRTGDDTLPNFTLHVVSGDAFSNFYKLAYYNVSEMGQLISANAQTFFEALGTATDYKQSNILDYIVSFRWYPVPIADATIDTATNEIQFGYNGASKLTFTNIGCYLLSNANRIFDLGSIYVPYRTSEQSFLDLEPYTRVSMYLPYIGTVTLQSNQVLGHTINCRYVIDIVTGVGTAIVDNGFDTIYIGTGKIGVDISVSGNDIITQSASLISGLASMTTGISHNAVQLAGSAISGNVAGVGTAVVDTIADVASSALTIASAKRGNPQTVGQGSGFGCAYTHQRPYITVLRPAVSIPAKYGHDVGYVCNRTYTLGTISGFTICKNPDLSGLSESPEMLNELYNILTTGFYA